MSYVVIRRQLPLVAFEPVERNRSDIEEGLRSGEFDLAAVLVPNLSTAPDIGRENLLKSPRQLWTALDHPLAHKKSVTLVRRRELADRIPPFNLARRCVSLTFSAPTLC